MTLSFFNTNFSQNTIKKNLVSYLSQRYPHSEQSQALIKKLDKEGSCGGFTVIFLYSLWLSQQPIRHDVYGVPIPRDDVDWFKKTLNAISLFAYKKLTNEKWIAIDKLALLTPSFYLSDSEQLAIDSLLENEKKSEDDRFVIQLMKDGLKAIDLTSNDRQKVTKFILHLTSLNKKHSQDYEKIRILIETLTSINKEIILDKETENQINFIYSEIYSFHFEEDVYKKLKAINEYFLSIERFISAIDYFQSTLNYQPIAQGNLHQSFEDSRNRKPLKEYSLVGYFTLNDLTKEIMIDDKKTTLLEILSQPNRLILVGGYKHVTGCFAKSFSNIWFYNSNDTHEPINYTQEKITELVKVFFSSMHYSPNDIAPLAFNIFTFTNTTLSYPKQSDLLNTLNLQEPSNLSKIDGHSTLHIAAMNGCLESLKFALIKNKTNINSTTHSKGNTPLHYAAQNGCIDIVSLLIEQGANVEMVNNKKMSALFVAAKYGHLNIVKILIANGANIHQGDFEDTTPLHIAAQHGNLEIISYLIEKGADVKAKNTNQLTPFYVATSSGHLDVMKFLIDKGADLQAASSNGFSPLHAASEKGNLKTIEFLVARGADINAKSVKGLTPLYIAAKNGYLEVLKYLLQQNALMVPIEIPTSILLAEAKKRGKKEFKQVNALLKKSKRILDFSILHAAIFFGHKEIVEALLNNGANIEGNTLNGISALDFANAMNHTDISKLLVKAQALKRL